MGTRKWTTKDLRKAAKSSLSIREVIIKLGLVPAGGNYEQIKATLREEDINTDNFTGKGWQVNRTFGPKPRIPLSEILVKYSTFQSFKLKKRLFQEGLKKPQCELCGWAEQSLDGRIPLELDHVNGDHYDNRIENLRILCPNCHSLQPTHRGRNQRRRTASSLKN
jgi:5-methylcytosine-specific restriction endonuclease McrA